jgi:hypothetical protein
MVLKHFSAKNVKRFLESKHLPLVLGIFAVLIMLPVLKNGLAMDDLAQRIPQLEPSQIQPALYKTGMVPEKTGELSTVLFETFGFPRDRTRWELARNYGILPWWIPPESKSSLWRPFSAFIHWVDYRIFPDSPVLMHAHNLVWFGVVVLLASLIYRQMLGPAWIAGLAALMFVLDKNTYFPVMFVANRGFFIALCFGLLCFAMHHKWRSTKSVFAAVLSVIFLALSVLSNEAGVSTFAFILAYALVLDKSSRSKRFLSLLPAVLLIIVWRVIYQSLGYGISGLGTAYLDPGQEPLRFLYHLPGYVIAVIAGQLSALPPEVMFGLEPKYFNIFFVFYLCFTAVSMYFFLPVIRRNTIARFWFAVMLFAAIPVSTVPSSKNFGFMAVGAFGFIAVFVNEFIKSRSPARIFCIILLVAHIPLSVTSRLFSAIAMPAGLTAMANPGGLRNISLTNDTDVVIVNAPAQINAATIPSNADYYGRMPVPNSVRALAFAYTALEIKRIDEKSLMFRSKEDNIFTPDQSGPAHFSRIFAMFDRFFYNNRTFEKNRRFVLEGMTVEVLALDDKNLPKEIVFTFDVPLEHERFCWLQFNWQKFLYEPFKLPEIGGTVITKGPEGVRFPGRGRFLLK